MVEQYFRELEQGLNSPSLSWHNLRKAYQGRAYHNLDHLEEMLAHLKRLHQRPRDEIIFTLSLLYHDLVYKPTRKDNEARSANSACDVLHAAGNIAPARIRKCESLILSTKHHLPPEDDDGDAALLIDLDLAVLARPAEGYDRYRAAIRREFWMLPGFVYRKGRTKVLTGLLDRPHIYHTDYGRDTYEAPARENLWRELRSI